MITMTVLPLVRERDITIGWMYYQVIHRLSMDILHGLPPDRSLCSIMP